ncbi:MAG TPA: LuxR C-terminal-related transcriptional regulator [Acidimicrobiales bacterium]|jgi:DNA-binding NarL/FixJ family response regulator|nr:LuxR C-terminal-related transcriptional regulator [Acidimicrobiales bacterium]
MSELHRSAGGAVATVMRKRPERDLAPPITVSILGRDAILRSGVATYLRACPAVAVVPEKATSAGVVLLATDLIDREAVAALHAVRQRGVAGIVVLASRLDADQGARAAAAGACAWLGRWAATPRALAEAVAAAAACSHLADDHTRTWSAASAGRLAASDAISLSGRNLDVLRRVADGQSSAVIAEDLAYSESTIKGIVHEVVAALGAKNRTHAVSIAIRRGVI